VQSLVKMGSFKRKELEGNGLAFTDKYILAFLHDGQCCQVRRRQLRQLNENLPLLDEKTPLIQIFKKSATFPLFLAFNYALIVEN
jgi:hypothetical protein